MIDTRFGNENCNIFKELNSSELANFFDKKDKKFLHQVDTFYYAAFFNDDFTKHSVDDCVLKLREYLSDQLDKADIFEFRECSIEWLEHSKGKKGYIPADFPQNLILSRSGFAGMYCACISNPDCFDIFIAPQVPNEKTSPIVVQIRSYYLWMHGVHKAFEKSYATLKVLIDFFGLHLEHVQENRTDFCWHSNYIQNPERFLSIDNIARMRVSHMKDGDFHVEFRGNQDVDVDYFRLGRLKSNNILLRIYNKGKEVVENGYKGWFFKIWFLHGLINRYDLYLYEKCYAKRSWEYLNKARLQFYIDYGNDQNIKNHCAAVIDDVNKKDYDDLKKLANSLTPKPTAIMNVEFQTMRKFTSTIKLVPFRHYSGECKRVYEFLDNRKLIIDYLTHDVCRFVDYDPERDTNKSRCQYTNFWSRLRSTKLVDTYVKTGDVTLVREYANNLSKQRAKERALTAISTYSVYDKGENTDSIAMDANDFLCSLNDNDMYAMWKHKVRKIMQLGDKVNSLRADESRELKFIVVDKHTGEYIYYLP